MNARMFRILIAMLLLAILLLQAGGASFAAPGADEFELGWSTMGGGGDWMTSQDGVYGLGATLGQPGVGEEESTGGDFSLLSGFWSAPEDIFTYLPLVAK